MDELNTTQTSEEMLTQAIQKEWLSCVKKLRVPQQWNAVHDNILGEPANKEAVIVLALREIIHNGVAYGADNFWIYNIRRVDGKICRDYILIAHNGRGFDNAERLQTALELGVSMDDSGIQGHGMKAAAFYLMRKEQAELIVISKQPTDGKIIARNLVFKTDSLLQSEIDGEEWISFLSKNSFFVYEGVKESFDFTPEANVFVLMKYREFDVSNTKAKDLDVYDEGEEDEDTKKIKAIDKGCINFLTIYGLMHVCDAANKPKINFFATQMIKDGGADTRSENVRVALTKADYADNFVATRIKQIVKNVVYKGVPGDCIVYLKHFPCLGRGGNTHLVLNTKYKNAGRIVHGVGSHPLVTTSLSGDFTSDGTTSDRLSKEPIFFTTYAGNKKNIKCHTKLARILGLFGADQCIQTMEELIQTFPVVKEANSKKVRHAPMTTFELHFIPYDGYKGRQVFGEISHVFFANTGYEDAQEFMTIVIEKLCEEMDNGLRAELKQWIEDVNTKYFPKREVNTDWPEIFLTAEQMQSLFNKRSTLILEAVDDLKFNGQICIPKGQEIHKIPAPYGEEIYWRVFVKNQDTHAYETRQVVQMGNAIGQSIVKSNGLNLRATNSQISNKTVYLLEIPRVCLRQKGLDDLNPKSIDEYTTMIALAENKERKLSPGRLLNVQMDGDNKIYRVNVYVDMPIVGSRHGGSGGGGKDGSSPGPDDTDQDNKTKPSKNKDGRSYVPYVHLPQYPHVYVTIVANEPKLNTANRTMNELSQFARNKDFVTKNPTLKERLLEDWAELYRIIWDSWINYEDAITTLKMDARERYERYWMDKFGDDMPEAIGIFNLFIQQLLSTHAIPKKIRKALNISEPESDAVFNGHYLISKKQCAAMSKKDINRSANDVVDLAI